MNQGLRAYLISTAFYLVPGGIQMVLFPWLVAIYLHETPERVGFAQMAGQLPMLVLILWGGLVGDRIDQRRLLVMLHALMVIPPLVMAALVQADFIVYEILLAWAMVGGALGAFVQPARDALLNRVAGRDIQKVVTLTIGVQFGIQILGFALGSTADVIGPATLMCAQALCMVGAVITTLRIPALPAAPTRAKRPALGEIAEGIAIAWRSDAIRPAVVQTFAVGIFFAGAYMVLLPLMVRDLYQGGAGGIALAFAANMLGTCTTIVYLMRTGGVARPGRALLLGAIISSGILSLLYFDLPAWAFYAVVYLWGLCGGISMTMGRAIVQEASPETHRARLMSVYSLGMMGGMPIGSVLIGWCVGFMGARNAVLVPVFGMLIVLGGLLITSRLWHVQRQPNAL